jgi:NAD(P)-dependent dehydrogenase (short-subunit alcohol dehydrogenase family)
MNPFILTNKVIVITGASSGIGQQCAISCSEQGAKIVLVGRDINKLSITRNRMLSPDVHLICQLDLTNLEKMSLEVEEIVRNVGPIDGLINCAGIPSIALLGFVNFEKIETIFKANVFGGYLLTKEFCRKGRFNRNGGSIIFISSIMGLVGETAKSLYSMSKGALISGVRSLACELAPKKIRVNCISPGAIITPINRDLPYITDAEQLKKLEEKHLLGLGSTNDVANACIYLLSDASKWVTGTNLIVDGGYTAK